MSLACTVYCPKTGFIGERVRAIRGDVVKASWMHENRTTETKVETQVVLVSSSTSFNSTVNDQVKAGLMGPKGEGREKTTLLDLAHAS